MWMYFEGRAKRNCCGMDAGCKKEASRVAGCHGLTAVCDGKGGYAQEGFPGEGTQELFLEGDGLTVLKRWQLASDPP